MMEFCSAFHNRVFLFSCACISGILFALVCRKYEQTVQLSLVHNHYSSALRDSNYHHWLRNHGHSRRLLSEEDIKYSKNNKYETESAFLYKNVSVLCLAFVNSHSGAEAVKQTWAKHCNIVSFFGRFVDNKIPVMKVPPLTSFEGFCYAFIHVWKKYKDQFQWIFIADDLTYALMENLRYYVAPLNSSIPYYLGHSVKDFSSLYNIGSAGIVLSYGSMVLISSVYKSARDCTSKRPPSWYFDHALGKILETFSVHPVDTRDAYSRSRFNPFSVETMLIPGSISVFSSYWRTSAYLSDEGLNCCSDNAITFHDITPSKMYLLEYLLHHHAVFQNSPKGLGNIPVNKKAFSGSNQNSVDEFNWIQTGKAFVENLDSNFLSKKSKVNSNSKDQKNVIQNIWNDIFGN